MSSFKLKKDNQNEFVHPVVTKNDFQSDSVIVFLLLEELKAPGKCILCQSVILGLQYGIVTDMTRFI